MVRPYGLAGTSPGWDALIGVALIPALSRGRGGWIPTCAGMTIGASVSVRGMTDGGYFS